MKESKDLKMSMSTLEPTSSSKILEKKAALESLEILRKQREEQFQKYRKEIIERNQPFLDKALSFCKKYKDIRQTDGEIGATSCSEANETSQTSFNQNITADSSVTGHLMRCFNDSTENPPNVSRKNFMIPESPNHEAENEDKSEPHSEPLKASSKKPAKQFLKKRSGLERYMPKSKRPVKSSDTCVPPEPQNKFLFSGNQQNLKTIQELPLVSKKNHVQFKDTDHESDANTKTGLPRPLSVQIKTNYQPSTDTYNTDLNTKTNAYSKIQPNSCASSELDDEPNSNAKGDLLQDVINPVMDGRDLNQENERHELAEFELLENCAQNSSFNSDCSLVQRVIRGDPIRSPSPSCRSKLNEQPVIASPFGKLDFTRFRQEALMRRKKMGDIQNIMSDNEELNNILRKEICNQNEIVESERQSEERSSTPIEKNSSSQLANTVDAGVVTKHFLNDYIAVDDDRNQESANALARNNMDFIENKVISCDNHSPLDGSLSELKEQLRIKINKLEKEIETYQELCRRQEETSKEMKDISKKLNMERVRFDKYKEEQMEKMKEESEKERQQLKRERKNFNLLKEHQKVNFTNNERKELVALRKENEKLLEDLKRERIKYSNDMRKKKNQLITAENERDSYKLKCSTLEEQCEELLASLSRCNKNKKSKASESNCEEDSSQSSTQISSDSNNNKMKKRSSLKSFANDKNSGSNEIGRNDPSKKKVIFDLPPQCDDLPRSDDINDNSPETECYSKDSEDYNSERNDLEITVDEKVDRVLPNGDREIIFISGTKKLISAEDGTVKTIFYNGDIKYIYPDKREIYQYVNGVIDECFPSGIKVTTFPDGQIERLMPSGEKLISFPNGQNARLFANGEKLVSFPNGHSEHLFANGEKKVKLPSGVTHYFYTDGTEVVTSCDGMKATILPDGTKIVESENGEREIVTATFKRREFADGSLKIIFSSGRKETRYSNGRIKVQDKDGNVIIDTKYRRSR